MKLRILNSSLRFRLTQKEFTEIKAGRSICAQLEFSEMDGDIFKYEIVVRRDISRWTASKHPAGGIKVSIPACDMQNWAESGSVGISQKIEIPANRHLKILVEKDYSCLQVREGEDDVGTFPHPNTRELTC